MDSPYVFLSYAKEDADAVRRLHGKLRRDGMPTWVDEHNLLPGQDWDLAVREAIGKSGAFLACLSSRSVSKTGYVQKEIREALSLVERSPEGRVFIVPVRLDDCAVPESLRRWHWIDLYSRGGYQRLLKTLTIQAGLRQLPSKTQKTARALKVGDPRDALLLDLFERHGHFLYGRVSPSRVAVSQGHFMVIQRTMPPVFRQLKSRVSHYRRLEPSAFVASLPPGEPWRKAECLVRRIAPLPGSDTIILKCDLTTAVIHPDYWRIGLLFCRKPQIYIRTLSRPSGGRIVYFEDDGEPVVVVMGMLLDAEDKQSVRKALGK